MPADATAKNKFNEIAEEVYEPLQRYLRRRASRPDAEDALSEVLLTAHRPRPNGPSPALVLRNCTAGSRQPTPGSASRFSPGGNRRRDRARRSNEQTPIAAEPLELNAPADDPMASCIVFSTEELARVAEIAFGGTVASVDGSTVTLTVDDWFKGGDATEVVLNAPQGMEALIGGIPFAPGEQYLISAQDGTVNYCGFSGLATPEYRAAFQQAFGN